MPSPVLRSSRRSSKVDRTRELTIENQELKDENDRLRKDYRQVSQELMEYKYKELSQIRDELEKTEEESYDRETLLRHRELVKREGILERNLKEFQKKNIRNILIIGEEGKGKSTLANVLSSSDYFLENPSSFRVPGIKDKEFDVG